MMAAKLIRAKEIALEVDAEYYRELWADSHEACPDWMPPPDEAARDSYLGDGYFVSWCADVVHRQLLRAQADCRFAYGQTLLTGSFNWTRSAAEHNQENLIVTNEPRLMRLYVREF